MKDLINFLEQEMEPLSGRSRQQFENWIFVLRIEFPESFHAVTESALHTSNSRADVIIGVNRRIKENGIGGENVYWIARATGADGKILTKNFNIEKYGERNAFKLACFWRYNWCGTLKIINASKLPCLPTVPYEYVNDAKTKAEKKRADKSKIYHQAELW